MSISAFNILVVAWMALAVVMIPLQLKITAPYGRHSRRGWGPMLDNRLGWIVMEIASPLVFAAFFLQGDNVKTTPMWIFFGLWMAHYTNRSLLFPLRLRTTGKKMPVSIVLSALLFNIVNGFTNGYWLGTLGPSYPEEWLSDPRFISGSLLFLTGAAINQWADNRLIHLRRKTETGYRIPHRGLFRWISCPNHFGEIIEWTGFALMCWNLPALSFALWTAANLIPRAMAHHRWYRNHFDDYPAGRKAVLPGVI